MRRAFLVLAILLAFPGCGRMAAPGSQSPNVDEAPTATATPEPTALPAAVELLDCDADPSELGGFLGGYAPEGAGDTPDAAFDSFLGSPFTIPRSGYRKLFEDGDGAVYAYLVDGHVKVVVVVSDRYADIVGAKYAVDELRSCDPTEYGPTVDLGEGRTVWAHPDGRIMSDIVGPGHCDWQSARILHLTEDGDLVAQYIRDPEGIFPPDLLLETYGEGVAVPADASPSGYRHGDQELWFSEADRALYVVDASGMAERWPKAARAIGCA